MTLNGFNILSYFCLLLMLFSNAQAKKPKYKKHIDPKYIHYLHKYGYLDKNPSVSAFDDTLKKAVKTYQTNFHLKPTGKIDCETAAMMMMPRCGVADIINGTNFMRAKTKNESCLSSYHTGAHYTFFGFEKWSTMALTYSFMPNVPSKVVGPVERAFGRWASATLFTFSKVESIVNADLVIGWFSGEHGDGFPFDGPGGVLAHAAPPTGGGLHYDADENWSVELQQNAFHLETIATHEIGHLLGLGHSSDPSASMWPSVNPGVAKGLNDDDINGIRTLYNF